MFMLGSQAYLIMQNIFEAPFWFLLPVSMVICNDIMAYLFGKLYNLTFRTSHYCEAFLSAFRVLLWAYQSYQTVPQQNLGGFSGGMCVHCHFWIDCESL